ncbi:hypothetical protein Tco_1425834, partial [Tanacetum coccineum]
YRKSATSERSKIVKDLNKPLTHMDYVNSRIEMVGLILFGPEKARSTLHSVRAPERIVDDLKCFKSTALMLEIHQLKLPLHRFQDHKITSVHVSLDASLGLCECGNDEWRSLQNGTWSAVMSPYVTNYIDVKYTRRIYDSVTVTLDQVSQEWRYLLLVVGFFLLLLAPVVCKWVMRVIALTCIFESSIDTPLAIVAVVTCLGLYIVMSSIK